MGRRPPAALSRRLRSRGSLREARVLATGAQDRRQRAQSRSWCSGLSDLVLSIRRQWGDAPVANVARMFISVISAALVLSLMAPASGQPGSTPWYSVAYENNNAPPAGGSYRGVSVERVVPNIDTNMTGAGCSALIFVDNVNTAIWAVDFEEGWIEFGTYHQCETQTKRDYAVHGWSFNPYLWDVLRLGTATANSAVHRYTLTYFSSSWNWYLDGSLWATLPKPAPGEPGLRWADRIDAGLEAHLTGTDVPFHGYTRLREKLSNGWSPWEGKDGSLTFSPYCGGWLNGADDEWSAWSPPLFPPLSICP